MNKLFRTHFTAKYYNWQLRSLRVPSRRPEKSVKRQGSSFYRWSGTANRTLQCAWKIKNQGEGVVGGKFQLGRKSYFQGRWEMRVHRGRRRGVYRLHLGFLRYVMCARFRHHAILFVLATTGPFFYIEPEFCNW